MQLLNVEGRRFGELDGSVARKCHYCGKMFFKKRSSNRIYCRNSKCRHQARMIGLTRKYVHRKREWPAEYTARWEEIFDYYGGWIRLIRFMKKNEGR